LSVYVDTSVLVAYYCPELLSTKAETFITHQVRPVISSLTEIEFFSAMSRKVREKSIYRRDASRIAAKFLTHVNSQYYASFPVEDHHYKLARDWIGMFSLALRTLDALHLAICSSEGLDIVTADPALFRSAKALSLNSILLQ
jgi:uncharacterized protein